jgi:hypothetical protein
LPVDIEHSRNTGWGEGRREHQSIRLGDRALPLSQPFVSHAKAGQRLLDDDAGVIASDAQDNVRDSSAQFPRSESVDRWKDGTFSKILRYRVGGKELFGRFAKLRGYDDLPSRRPPRFALWERFSVF